MPPSPTRPDMGYDLALQQVRRIDTELKKLEGERAQLAEQKALLEPEKAKILKLKERLDEINAELTKPANAADQAIISALMGEAATLSADLPAAEVLLTSIEATLARIEDELTEIATEKADLHTELQAPVRVINERDKASRELPPQYMKERYDEYQDAVQKRQEAIKAAGEAASLEAMDAIERDIQPILKLVDIALRRRAKPEIPKAMLDRAEATLKVPSTLDRLLMGNLRGYLTVLRQYQSAYESWSKAKNVGVTEAALATVALETATEMLATGRVEIPTAQFKKAREDYAAYTLPAIQAATQTDILAGELNLVDYLDDDEDRIALVDSIVGKTEQKGARHPFMESLKTFDGSLEYLQEVLGRLGLPKDYDEFTKAMQARKVKNTAAALVTPELAKDNIGLLEQMADEVVYRLGKEFVPEEKSKRRPSGAKLKSNRREEAEARVLNGSLPKIDPRVLETVVAAVDPAKKTEDNLAKLAALVRTEFLEKLVNHGNNAIYSEEPFKKAYAALTPLALNFHKIFTGEFQAAQVTAGLPENDRLDSPDKCIETIAKAEGRLVFIDPKIVAARKDAKEWVAKFEASIKRETEVKAEIAKLNQAFEAAQQISAKTFDTTVHIGEIQKKLREARALEAQMTAFRVNRGTADDPLTANKERNRKRHEWTANKAREVIDCKRELDVAQRAFNATVRDLERQIANENIIHLREQVRKGDALVADLESPDWSGVDFDSAGSDHAAFLKEVAFDSHGKKFISTLLRGEQTPLQVIHYFQYLNAHRPLADERAHTFYIPERIRHLSLTELLADPYIVQAAYSETLRTIDELSAAAQELSQYARPNLTVLKQVYDRLLLVSAQADPDNRFQTFDLAYPPATTEALTELAYAQICRLTELTGGLPARKQHVVANDFAELANYLKQAMRPQVGTFAHRVNETLRNEQTNYTQLHQAFDLLLRNLKENIEKQNDACQAKVDALKPLQDRAVQNEAAVKELEEKLKTIEERDIEAELVDKFDTETETEAAKLDTAGILADVAKIPVFEGQIESGKKVQARLKEELYEKSGRFIEALATWLGKQKALLTPTDQPTELETMELAKAAKQSALAQEIVIAVYDAEVTDDPVRLRNWWKTLPTPKYEAIMNKIIYGLYQPQPQPQQQGRR